MPSDAISISPETAKQLDSTALLRRLLQKGNMQMRPVTLPEGWHKKDMGVFIGFYSPPGAGNEPFRHSFRTPRKVTALSQGNIPRAYL